MRKRALETLLVVLLVGSPVWAQSFAATPIPDLKTGTYLGFQGGLYEQGKNQTPIDHHNAGLNMAAEIQPLDSAGLPSTDGKIVFMSLGVSIARDQFQTFMNQAASDSRVNHASLVMINAATPGYTACRLRVAYGPVMDCSSGMHCSTTSSVNPYDYIRDNVLAPAGITEAEVQIIWLETVNALPGPCGMRSLCDPSLPGCVNDVTGTEALRYESHLGSAMRAARTRYSNLKQVFLTSPVYFGYSTWDLNSEPYSYEYGFAHKWLIQAQIAQRRTGTVDPVAGELNYAIGVAPWIVWGPYLWASDNIPRSDGLTWPQSDFAADGLHLISSGLRKVSNRMITFFLNSQYTPWFRP